MTNGPDLLIVTASPPGEMGVGQNYMKSVCPCLPAESMECFALLRESESMDKRAVRSAGIRRWGRSRLRFEYAFRRGPSAIADLTNWAGVKARLMPYADKVVSEVLQFVGETPPKRLLVVLESPLLILIASRLASRLGCPLVTLVWDHPDHVIRKSFSHSGRAARSLRREADLALGRSDGILTVSDELASEYQNLYPGKAVAAVRAPSLDRASTDSATRNSHAFVIGFAGSVTAPQEFAGLQTALDSVNWVISGRPVELRLFGARYVLGSSAPRRVAYHGFLETTAEVAAALGDCDVTFLPQPFADDQRLLASYSFPSKLSAYLAGGRPVVVYGPPHASIVKFAQANPMGAVCCQQDQSALIKTLTELSEESNYRRAVADAEATRRRAFSVDACRQALRIGSGCPGDENAAADNRRDERRPSHDVLAHSVVKASVLTDSGVPR